MLEARGRHGRDGERVVLARVHPESSACLGIEIHEDDPLAVLVAGDGERRGEGSLADAAFLGDERKDFHSTISLYRLQCIHS